MYGITNRLPGARQPSVNLWNLGISISIVAVEGYIRTLLIFGARFHPLLKLTIYFEGAPL